MAGRPTTPKATSGGLAPWQMEMALRVLLTADHSIAHIAALCGLSRSHFERAFKVSVGTPPHRWLVRQRVRRAGDMLEWTDDSISRIAFSCGFADQSHLTRVFRGMVGSSPAAWRRRRKAGLAPPLRQTIAPCSPMELEPRPGL